jgi:tetratricopeptide (TPR) repeat protein
MQCCAVAQKSVADSLLSLLATEKIDSNKVTLLWKVAAACNNYNLDTALILAKQSLTLAQKIKFTDGESKAYGTIAKTFSKIGNYPKALENFLGRLKIAELQNDARNLAGVTMNIGTIYVYQEEYRKALPYYFAADSISKANNYENLFYNIALNLGDVYNRLNINDTAFIYFNKSLSLANKLGDDDLIGTSLVGLGNSFYKQNNYASALQHYKQALPYLQKANDDEVICEASIGLAKVYDKLNKNDSAQSFAHNTFAMAKRNGYLLWELEATSFLKNFFKKLNKSDSALLYVEQSQLLKDSISSKDRVRESQILSSNEQIRQAEINENKRIAKVERQQQLQFLFIGIFIPLLFLFTLFLSRIKVHTKVIKLMGILSLLIFFEYLTLLLHPYVLNLTHHTPVFEIMIFVCIAAILIPTHHRIEHWLIEKLTQHQKNYTAGGFKIKLVKLRNKKTPE